MNHPDKTPLTGYEDLLSDLKSSSLLRSLRQMTTRKYNTIVLNEKKYLNLSSNDYLGLATNTKLLKEFYSRLGDDILIDQFGLGSSSSRLLTGNFKLYDEMESFLSQLYENRSALVFNSGYHANIGMIPALAGTGDLILSDSLNHASVVDGIRLSRATCLIFPHNDMDALDRLLVKSKGMYRNIWIIAESVFSMDGDLADLSTLVRLKENHNALLYIDEAHSIGLYDDTGLGLSPSLGLMPKVDVMLCPMGKALASHGAYAVMDEMIRQVLVNRMRSLLYTTALPPIAINWNLFVIKHLDMLNEKRSRLQRVSRYLREKLDEFDIAYTGESHIIPVLAGDSDTAVQMADYLQKRGFLVFPIRWPTVPKGQDRIRISLTSDIREADISSLPELISAFLKEK